MSEIKLHLFGPPRLERDGRQVEIHRRKAMAILFYLAVTRQPQSRDSLATLFWPELSQSQARGNLRRALSELNHEVGSGLLLLEGDNVTLVNDGLWIDIFRFRDCLYACSTHAHPAEQICPDCISLLEQAVGLYQADFLAGFTLRDTVKFDDWQYFEAEGLRQEFASALERLVNGLSNRGDLERAIVHARRWLNIDPLHETAQHTLIRLYHQTGQSTAAIRQYELYVELLEKEIGVAPTPETLHLYEEIKTNRKSTGDKISARQQIISRPVNNLPAQPTSFLGREEELAEIIQLLTYDPQRRLITLVGPGGIGKTRLSVEAAARAGDAFHDGTAFVSLASISEPASIVPAIAGAIQFNFQGDAEPKEQLLHHLRQKNYLLVLDNFEHLLSAAFTEKNHGGEVLISEMLQAASRLKLMVTSRECLQMQEEWVFDVQGMAFPPESTVPEANAHRLDHYPAIQLFLDRAKKADSRFVITDDDMVYVIRICRLVGGMPLGIELAAPWVRLMSCREIADEIERSFDLLETSLRNVPERHRSMRAILEQTWEQLTTEEKNILSRLSIFRGGCSRQAAETVTHSTPILFRSLMDKALLRRVNGRYELHELIRQFASEQLQNVPEIYNQSKIDHHRYYCGFLEQQVHGLKSGSQLETVNRITADIDNVRAAWQQAVESLAIEAIEQSAESLFLYSEMRGRLVEAETLFRQASTRLSEAADHETNPAVRETYESVIGYLLVLQGVMALHTGNPDGLVISKRGTELVRRHTDDTSRQSQYRKAFCLMWLGWASFLPGFYDDSRQYFEDALGIFIPLGEHWGIAKTLFMKSNSDIAQGRLIEAEQDLRKSLSICREIQDSRSRILVNRTLGIVTLWFGDLPLTQQLLEEAVQLSHEFNDLLGLENTLRELGKLQAAQGDLQLAAQTLLHSIEICREIGAHWEGELAYCDLGDLYRVQGDYDAAELALQRGLDAAIATKNRWWHPRCLAELGCIAGYRKQYGLAEKLIHEALNLWKELNHQPFLAWGLAQLGHMRLEQNNLVEANRLYQEGLALALKHRQAPIALNIFVGLAKVLSHAGEPNKAAMLLHLARHHPASYYETKEHARRCLENLGLDPIPPDAQARSKPVNNWQVIAAAMIDRPASP